MKVRVCDANDSLQESSIDALYRVNFPSASYKVTPSKMSGTSKMVTSSINLRRVEMQVAVTRTYLVFRPSVAFHLRRASQGRWLFDSGSAPSHIEAATGN